MDADQIRLLRPELTRYLRFIRRKRTSRRPQGSTGASSLFIDAPKPLAFLELRPSGNREEAPVLQVCVRAHANFG